MIKSWVGCRRSARDRLARDSLGGLGGYVIRKCADRASGKHMEEGLICVQVDRLRS